MNDFIFELTNCLSEETCNNLIELYKGSNRKFMGRIGSGVDVNKKLSVDLNVDSEIDWQSTKQLKTKIFQSFVGYFRENPILLTGALSTHMLDKESSQTRVVEIEDILKMSDLELFGLASKVYSIDKINMQQYKKLEGGYFHWHSEHYPHPTDAEQKSLHRVLFFILYLNDVENGGDTEFFYQNRKVQPEQGKILIAPSIFTHSHRGNMPLSNDKYVLTGWLNFRSADELFQFPKNHK